jgi:hypothetical protein
VTGRMTVTIAQSVLGSVTVRHRWNGQMRGARSTVSAMTRRLSGPPNRT